MQGVIFLVYAISFWYGGQLVGEGNITFDQMLKVGFDHMLMQCMDSNHQS